MKNYIYFILFSILLISCDHKDIQEIDSQISKQEYNTDVTAIQDLGFDSTDIKDIGDSYLVEGDIILTKKALRLSLYDYNGNSSLKQARRSGLIASGNERNVTVRVDNSIPTTGADNWRSEVQTAINHWNALTIYESNLRFAYTTAPTADITIREDNGILEDGAYYGPGDYRWQLAAAESPLDGKAGYQIRINLDTDNNRTMSSSQKVFTMVHELGHCVGLRHTNWYNPNPKYSESTGIGIAGTPNTGTNPDPNSVMNGGTALNSWNGFSYYDKIAIKNLYPYILITRKTTASGPNYMPSKTGMIEWEHTGNIPNVTRIDWWYRKVGGAASILIDSGETVQLRTVPDTYYSNKNYRTSDFKLYVKVYTADGHIYISDEYDIMKKGMYKIISLE